MKSVHTTSVFTIGYIPPDALTVQVIRKRATKLADGSYGATFKGIKLLNATAGVRLNFTMSHPGVHEKFYGKYALKSPKFSYSNWNEQMDAGTPDGNMYPTNYERVGLGFLDYTPIWAKDSTRDFLGT